MMARDYSSVFDEHEAGANLNGAQGVPQSAAVLAFKSAPETGVAPSLGMTDPSVGTDLSAMKRDRALLEVPAIKSFASTSPAHVAATRDDWPALAKVAGKVDSWNALATQDFFAPGVEAGNALVKDFKRWYTAAPGLIPGFNKQDWALGSLVGDVAALAFSPVTGALNVAARSLSAVPMPNADGRGGFRSQPETQAEVTRMLGTALAGLGAGRAVAPRAGGGALRLPAPAEPPPVRPAAPGVRPTETELYTGVAELDAARVAHIQESVAATTTQGQLPALTEEFLNHTPVASESAWVDPQAIVDLYADGHTVLPQYAQQVSEALSAGRDVQVPLSAYVADTSGKPYAEKLLAHSRFREEGVSVEEAKGLPTETASPEVVPSSPRKVGDIPEDIGPEHFASVVNVAAHATNAVEEVFAEQALKSLFVDNKAVGLTKGQFDRYDNMLAEAKVAASERILKRHYDQIRRERTPEWKERVAREARVVEGETFQHPELNAYSELTRGKDLSGESVPDAVKLSSAYRTEGLPANAFAADGLEPDDVAGFYGYATGQELLAALATVHDARGDQTLDAFVRGGIEEEATARARATLGYDVSPEGILAAAREEAVLPQVEDFLEASLKDLAAQAGLPFDKAGVKAEAQRQFNTLSVRDASKVRTFERGMWKTGNATQIALEKGKWPEAFVGRQQQLLNFYQLEMAHFLAKRVASGDKKFRRLAKKATVRGLAQPFLNQLHTYLPLYGYPNRRESQELAEALGGVNLGAFVTDVQVTNPAFPDVPLVTPADMRDLSVNDYYDVRAFIYAMDKYGRELQAERTTGKREEFAARRAEMLASVPPGKPPKTVEADTSGEGPQAKFLHVVRWYDALHRKPADMVEWLDRGNPLGVWHQTVIAPLYRASDTDGQLHREIYEPIVKLWEAIPAKVKRTYNARLPSPFTIGDTALPLQLFRRNVLPLALYTGTVESLEKAATGLGVEPPVLLDWINSHITPEEVAVVEGVWAKFAELAPRVSESLRRLTGQGLRMVEAAPVTLAGRTLRGGYVPIEYDRRPEVNPQVAAWEEEKVRKLSPDGLDFILGEVLPNRGFSEERTGFKGVVNMELSRLTRLFNSHIKYAAYAQPVSDVRKFVFDPLISATIVQKFGPEYLDVIPGWLNGIVAPLQSADGLIGKFDTAVEWVGKNMTVATLAGSYGTLMAQAAGWLNGVGVLSDGNLIRGTAAMAGGTKDTLVALARSTFTGKLGSPIEFTGFHGMFERSEMMRQRYGTLEQNMTEALVEADAIAVRGGVKKGLAHLERVLFHFIGWSEFVSASAPIWFAAEKQALAKGMSAEQSARFADRMVQKSQGGGRRVDMSAVQRSRGVMKVMYAFQSYFNQQYQLGIDVYRNVAGSGMGGGPPSLPPPPEALDAEMGPDGQWTVPPKARYSIAQAAILATTIYVLATMAGSWLTHRKQKPTDPIMTALRPLLWLNAIAYNVDRHLGWEDGHVVFKGNPGDTGLGDDQLSRAGEILLNNAYNLATWASGPTKSGRPRKLNRPLQNLIQLPSLALRLPGTNQVARSAEYLAEMGSHEQVPRSGQEWTDIITGLKYGPQAEQKVSAGRGGRGR